LGARAGDENKCQDNRRQPQLRQNRTHAQTWQRTAPDKYKCNVDASFSFDHNKVGI